MSHFGVPIRAPEAIFAPKSAPKFDTRNSQKPLLRGAFQNQKLSIYSQAANAHSDLELNKIPGAHHFFI